MDIRVYISAPFTLPRTAQSLMHLLSRLPQELRDRAVVIPSNPALFEYPTLHRLWKDTQQAEFYALYLHTKGASKLDHDEWANALAWMEYMLDGVCDTPTCFEHLDRGADLVGSQWYWHFKGNFWWARSSYVRMLPDPMALVTTGRLNAEYWVAGGLWRSGPIPRIKNLFYVPDLDNDSTYAAVRATAKPVGGSRLILSDDGVQGFVASGNLMAFDEIRVRRQDAFRYRTLLERHLNYDGKLIVIDDPVG